MASNQTNPTIDGRTDMRPVTGSPPEYYIPERVALALVKSKLQRFADEVEEEAKGYVARLKDGVVDYDTSSAPYKAIPVESLSAIKKKWGLKDE